MGLDIDSNIDLSNEFIKANLIQNSIYIFEEKIIEIASQKEQSEEINICTEEFIKSLLYLNALKKSTLSKFEKQNYLTNTIKITIN